MFYSQERHVSFSIKTDSVLTRDTFYSQGKKLCSQDRHVLFSRKTCSVLKTDMLCSQDRYILLSRKICSILKKDMHGKHKKVETPAKGMDTGTEKTRSVL